jgi:hypothetical protein
MATAFTFLPLPRSAGKSAALVASLSSFSISATGQRAGLSPKQGS